MVEPIGICEKHELPLDENGECELCRLDKMPSNAPPSTSPWWALIIPLLLLGAVVLWALSSFGTEPEVTPQRGVRAAQPQPASPAPVTPNAREPEPEPELPPLPAEPPTLGEQSPIEDIPVPEPLTDEAEEGTQPEQVPPQ